jgi:hypothetical protein
MLFCLNPLEAKMCTLASQMGAQDSRVGYLLVWISNLQVYTKLPQRSVDVQLSKLTFFHNGTPTSILKCVQNVPTSGSIKRSRNSDLTQTQTSRGSNSMTTRAHCTARWCQHDKEQKRKLTSKKTLRLVR